MLHKELQHGSLPHHLLLQVKQQNCSPVHVSIAFTLWEPGSLVQCRLCQLNSQPC